MDEEEREEILKMAGEMLGDIEMSALANAAMHMHEMFLGLQVGGFSEKQALYIIAMALLGQPQGDDLQ